MTCIDRPTESSIMTTDRTVSDKSFCVIFLLSVIFWLFIALYAFSRAEDTSLFPDNQISQIIDITSFAVIVGYVLLGGLLTIILYFGMRWLSSFPKIVFAVYWVPCIGSAVGFAFCTNYFLIYGMIGGFLSWLMITALLNTEWFHLSETILRETCKAIVFFPMAYFLLIICNIACAVVANYVAKIHIDLSVLKYNNYGVLPWYIHTLKVVNIVAGIWLFLYLFNIGQIMLSGILASWFWTENKKDLRSGISRRYFGRAEFSYTGTVAYATSIFGVLQVLRIMLVHVSERFRKGGINKSFIFFVVYNIFDMIVLRFTISCALVICAINGNGFYQSAKDSFDYLTKYSKRCVLVFKIIENILLFLTIALSILLLSAVTIYLPYLQQCQMEDCKPEFIFTGIILLACLILFVLPLFSMLIAGCNTFLVCCLMDAERNDGSNENPYAMSPELRQALMNNDGPPAWYRKCVTCCRTPQRGDS